MVRAKEKKGTRGPASCTFQRVVWGNADKVRGKQLHSSGLLKADPLHGQAG